MDNLTIKTNNATWRERNGVGVSEHGQALALVGQFACEGVAKAKKEYPQNISESNPNPSSPGRPRHPLYILFLCRHSSLSEPAPALNAQVSVPKTICQKHL